MKILGVIPARGGSKGILNKNIKELNGRPLIGYTIDAAKESMLNRFVVSTDCEKIAALSKKCGADTLMRPDHLAQDETPTLPVIQHVLDKIDEDYDAIMLLQPTSPIRNKNHINEAINLFIEKDKDSLVSVVKVPHNFSPESIYSIEEDLLVNYSNSDSEVYNRNDKKNYFARNGPAIILTRTKIIQEENSFYGEKTVPYVMSLEDSVDIDEPIDFTITELLMRSL